MPIIKHHVHRRFPRLFLFSDKNYRGRRFVWRGNVGLRNLDNLYPRGIESLRFFSPNPNATLVLFSRPNFQGKFKIYRGITNIADLERVFAQGEVKSLVSANFFLSPQQIRLIRTTCALPPGFRTI
ncbi:hypothetical protein Q5741_15390 [Paenibacillus sp. JX-17]|uniref:Uncharacterized protein n=1 Tax=Paenibacillus lacisoli TaxID=3064525 RepID=A0ABT9CFX6_9BACL|nr:hypothetical protein [Paenibacillus sp. JX-17]MDO7907795.1 hypothetical protein [Paenibacillus sp. JX-17]